MPGPLTFRGPAGSKIQPRYELLDVDGDVVLADLVEGVLQVRLDIVQANQDRAEKDRHQVLEPWRIVLRILGEIGAVENRQDENEDIAVGA